MRRGCPSTRNSPTITPGRTEPSPQTAARRLIDAWSPFPLYDRRNGQRSNIRLAMPLEEGAIVDVDDQDKALDFYTDGSVS